MLGFASGIIQGTDIRFGSFFPEPRTKMSNRTNSGTLPLALPAPASSDTSIHIDVNESSKMKLDALGPLVVNSDGVCLNG